MLGYDLRINIFEEWEFDKKIVNYLSLQVKLFSLNQLLNFKESSKPHERNFVSPKDLKSSNKNDGC